MLEEPLPISQSLDRPTPANSPQCAGGHQEMETAWNQKILRKHGAAVSIPRAPIDPHMCWQCPWASEKNLTWQNNGRHEDLENAIFTCSGWLFEHKVSFKYSASGEEANTVRLFSSVTVVSMGGLLTFRKADHEANPIPGCGNCAAAVIRD